MISAPAAAKSAVEMDFIAPFVAQNMKFGVETLPCGVVKIPRRAIAPSHLCVTVNANPPVTMGKHLKQIHLLPIKFFRKDRRPFAKKLRPQHAGHAP
jgi:hypothetical protein